jgi:hypothetical protein
MSVTSRWPAPSRNRGTLRRAPAFLDGSAPDSRGMDDAALRMVQQHLQQFGGDYAQHFVAAVPEPSTFALAFVGLGFLPRRRKR